MNPEPSWIRRAAPGPDLALLARRVVVAVAALAALVGILAGRPVLVVALRAGAIAVLGLAAVVLYERTRARRRAATRGTLRGGLR